MGKGTGWVHGFGLGRSLLTFQTCFWALRQESRVAGRPVGLLHSGAIAMGRFS